MRQTCEQTNNTFVSTRNLWAARQEEPAKWRALSQGGINWVPGIFLLCIAKTKTTFNSFNFYSPLSCTSMCQLSSSALWMSWQYYSSKSHHFGTLGQKLKFWNWNWVDFYSEGGAQLTFLRSDDFLWFRGIGLTSSQKAYCVSRGAWTDFLWSKKRDVSYGGGAWTDL